MVDKIADVEWMESLKDKLMVDIFNTMKTITESGKEIYVKEQDERYNKDFSYKIIRVLNIENKSSIKVYLESEIDLNKVDKNYSMYQLEFIFFYMIESLKWKKLDVIKL